MDFSQFSPEMIALVRKVLLGVFALIIFVCTLKVMLDENDEEEPRDFIKRHVGFIIVSWLFIALLCVDPTKVSDLITNNTTRNRHSAKVHKSADEIPAESVPADDSPQTEESNGEASNGEEPVAESGSDTTARKTKTAKPNKRQEDSGQEDSVEEPTRQFDPAALERTRRDKS